MKKIDQKTAKKFAKLVAAPKPKKFGDERDRMVDGKGNVRCTMPPRTRPGKAYPGGRRMRRALARLEASRKGTAECITIAGKKTGASKPANAFQTPGAMNP